MLISNQDENRRYRMTNTIAIRDLVSATPAPLRWQFRQSVRRTIRRNQRRFALLAATPAVAQSAVEISTESPIAKKELVAKAKAKATKKPAVAVAIAPVVEPVVVAPAPVTAPVVIATPSEISEQAQNFVEWRKAKAEARPVVIAGGMSDEELDEVSSEEEYVWPSEAIFEAREILRVQMG
jgi:uncharacterized membrane protein